MDTKPKWSIEIPLNMYQRLSSGQTVVIEDQDKIIHIKLSDQLLSQSRYFPRLMTREELKTEEMAEVLKKNLEVISYKDFISDMVRTHIAVVKSEDFQLVAHQLVDFPEWCLVVRKHSSCIKKGLDSNEKIPI